MGQNLVLIVENDPTNPPMIRITLQRQGYRVHEMTYGTAALAQVEEESPDLVIVTLDKPDMRGDAFCKSIRERSDVPIIVLSSFNQEAEKVQALYAGADDFMTRPFSQDELTARIYAIMRRATRATPSDDKIKIGGFTIDLRARRVFANSVDLHLTRIELSLLVELAKHIDEVIAHTELLSRVWGQDYWDANHYLHVYLGRIRKKMGEYSPLLETVPGLGYILHSSFANLPGSAQDC